MPYSEILYQVEDRVLQRTPGPCPVYLSVQDAAGKRSLLRSGQDFWINPGKLATGELELLLGPGHVQFTGPSNGNGRSGNGS